MGDPSPARRRSYGASLLSSDYFIVRGLERFLLSALASVVRPGAAVLDVGCGEQPLRAAVETAGGVYTGVDLAQNAAGTVEVVASAERVPLPDASFDVVVCTEVLEHVPDTDAAFAELVRLTRPGGAVVLTVPFVYRLHEEPHDHVRVTPHHVRRRAEDASLDVERLELLGSEIEVLASVWGAYWEVRPRPSSRPARALVNLVRRTAILAGNLAGAAAVAALRRTAPAAYAQSVVAILRKRPPEDG